MSRYCSVPQCSSWEKTNSNVQFHTFPQPCDKFRVWIEGKSGMKVLTDRQKAWQLKLKIGKPITRCMKVCSLHFTDDDYFHRDPSSNQRKLLKRNAVPSRNLPVRSIIKEQEQPECSSSRTEILKQRTLNKELIIEECSCEEIMPAAQTASADEIDAAQGLLQLLQGQPDYNGPQTSNDFEVQSPNEDLDKMEVVTEHTIKSIVRVNEFHCDMCNKKFKLYENRKEVQHKMDPNMKVECENCKAQHYNSANSPKPDKFEDKCPECSDILPNKKELEYHLLQNHRTVLKKDVYECEACPKKFIKYKSLMYHNATKHNLATVEDVVFKHQCEFFQSYIYKNKHLYECNKKYEKKRKQNSDEWTDTKVEKTTAIQNDLSVMKRKSLLISNGNYNKGGKNANLGGESNKCNSTSEEPDGIINKLEALIGVNNRPNSITIINLDE